MRWCSYEHLYVSVVKSLFVGFGVIVLVVVVVNVVVVVTAITSGVIMWLG